MGDVAPGGVPERGLEIGLFITLVTCNNVLFRWLNNLGKFDWLVHLVQCPNLSTTNCNLLKG